MASPQTRRVEVKWQKQVFKDVDIDLTQPATVFKMQLFSLTGVQPERQKIMGVKGGLLKDDADLVALGIKDGQKLTMMGTADAVPIAPTAQQTFVEDLPEDEQDTSGLSKYGAGLQNLGNTCYMNSTVQCLYAVPELRSSLDVYHATSTSHTAIQPDPTHSLTVAARNLFSSLERSAAAQPPMEFVLSLRRAFPQFDARSREGYHMQQDAEECWTLFLSALRERVMTEQGSSAISSLFGVKLRTVLKCEESEEARTDDKTELMLKCNITGEVNHLLEGIKVGLAADREQMSEQLGRNANFHGVGQITALPPYLTVQMVRFFYKADVQQKAKILRKVTFPLVLDVYEFCSDELKAALEAPRTAAKAAEDAKAGLAKRPKLTNGDTDMAEGTVPITDAAAATKGALTGRYELLGVLTHKGRSADSGHYVSWVKQPDGQWIQFDDEAMIVRREEEVMTLSGGGDWHMAYVLLYKGIRAPVE